MHVSVKVFPRNKNKLGIFCLNAGSKKTISYLLWEGFLLIEIWRSGVIISLKPFGGSVLGLGSYISKLDEVGIGTAINNGNYETLLFVMVVQVICKMLPVILSQESCKSSFNFLLTCKCFPGKFFRNCWLEELCIIVVGCWLYMHIR